MKIRQICLLLAYLLINLGYLVLVILDSAKVLDIPLTVALIYALVLVAASALLFISGKRPQVREVMDSSKAIQVLLYANVICAVLMMVIGGVLKCI